MSYNGPNEKGLTVMNSITEQIAKEYPNEKIYDNKKTKVDLVVSSADESTENIYKVILTFEVSIVEMKFIPDCLENIFKTSDRETSLKSMETFLE